MLCTAAVHLVTRPYNNQLLIIQSSILLTVLMICAAIVESPPPMVQMDDGTKRPVVDAPKRSLKKNGIKDTPKYGKLSPLHSVMLKDTSPTPNASSSKEQSSSHLSTSCSRCQSLKTGDSLHLTLAYRKCRCHRQFEHHGSKARPTAVNSTPTSSRSRIAELLPVAGSTLALSLPPIDLITSAKSCQQTSDHTAKKITEGNSCFTERLPSIVR